MTSITFEEILKKNEAQAELNATKFIPQPGTAYKVEIIGNSGDTCQWEKNGEIYKGVQFRVKIEGKEKTWRVFEGQAGRIVIAKQKHPNGVINVHVAGKQLEVS